MVKLHVSLLLVNILLIICLDLLIVLHMLNYVVHEIDKFMPRALECIFFDFVENNKACKLLYLKTNKLFFSRDLKFKENVFPFLLKGNVEYEDNKMFARSFPFHVTNICDIYEEIVPDKTSDSSFSFEEESIKNFERWNSETSARPITHAPVVGSSASNVIASEPILHCSTRIFKLSERLI